LNKMKLVVAKPSVAAFKRDMASSIKSLDDIAHEFGITRGVNKVNKDLEIDFGLQLILFDKHLESLEEIKEGVLSSTQGIPLSVHAPYNYGDEADWPRTDLSRGSQGLDNLKRVAEFSRDIGALSVAVHPNAIRTKEELKDPSRYNPRTQQEFLNEVISHVQEVNSQYGGIIDLENKPLPATTADNENPIFTTVFHPISHLEYYIGKGGTLTFDTCHYGITRETINGAIKRLGSGLTDEVLREQEMLGYFAKDFVYQPSIEDAMLRLGSAINHIHLNDGSVYRTVEETGLQDRTKKLPMVGGYQLWWEAYVPGKGELCKTDCIKPWLTKHQADDRTVTLTLEVTEFNKDYANNPRWKESTRDALTIIYSLR